MKVCPECGTQYEDHVPTCIADGVELAPAAQSAPTQIFARAPAPPPPAPSGPRLSVLLIVGLASGLVALLLGAGVVASQIAISRPSAPEPAARPTLVAPSPVAAEPREAPPVDVVFVSEPLGAKVFENDQFVCETPCTVRHPPHAPLPRGFVFKAAGYRDETYEMTEAKGPITVQLTRLRAAASPPGPSSAAPRPTIGRDR